MSMIVSSLDHKKDFNNPPYMGPRSETSRRASTNDPDSSILELDGNPELLSPNEDDDTST